MGVQQIDYNVENLTRAKKQKWEAEIKVKKYKSIQAKRIREASISAVNNSLLKNDTMDEGSNCANLTPAPTPSNLESETASEAASIIADDDKDGDTTSIISESTNDAAVEKSPSKSGKKGRPPKRSRRLKGKKRKNEDNDGDQKKETDNEDTKDNMDDTQDETQSSVNEINSTVTASTANEHLDEDEKLSAEELQKKIDKSVKQLNKRRDELTFVTNCMRCNDMGQDRYRRRYWHLAHGDGIYVESIESAEPWKLETEGLPHTDHDDRPPVSKRLKLDNELKEYIETGDCMETDDEEEVKD